MTRGDIPARSEQPVPENLPQCLLSILEDIDKSDHEARRIIDSVSDAQANWRPSETSWSIAQCIDHLARTNQIYTATLLEAIRSSGAKKQPFNGPIRTGLLTGPFLRSLEPPPKGKSKSPRNILPASATPRDEVLQAFLRSHDGLRIVIREGAGVDLNRTYFRNPFLKFLRFPVGAGLLIVNAHDRRHLWQAEQALGSTGFPAA